MCSSAAARLPPGGCVSPSPAPGGGRFLLSAAQCQPLGVVLTQGIAQALGIEDVGLVRDAIATPAGRDIGELRVGDRITYRGQEYVVKHDSAGVALRMTAADPGVYGDHPDYREEWRT